MKKLATMLLVLLLASTAVQAETSSLDAAKALVPPSAMLIDAEREDGLWEYEFRDEDFLYEVILDGEQAVALTEKNLALRPAKANALTQEKAIENIEGEILYVRAHREDGGWIWKVIVRQEEHLVEYELHAETGEIMEKEIYFSASLKLPETDRPLDLELDDGRLSWDWD